MERRNVSQVTRRRRTAAAALEAHGGLNREAEGQDAFTDAITDLLHLAEFEGHDVAAILRCAIMHYTDEACDPVMISLCSNGVEFT